jgi:uncharacterized repeat protein (TIGR03803 family)
MRARAQRRTRLHAELLEDRCVPSTTTVASFPSWQLPAGGLIEDSKGNLFGATTVGGTVFEVPARTDTVITLASFNNTDGNDPQGKLIEDTSGNLFGTTFYGGDYGQGTVFEVPAGTGTIVTLWSFSGPDGANPVGGLVEDLNGNLYGTTINGGASKDGTVFEVLDEKVGGKDQYIPVSLASFDFTDGAVPTGDLILDGSGNLFGTTEEGGLLASSDDYGSYGTVFEVLAGPPIYNGRTIDTLAAFNGANGALPNGGLVEETNGNLIGTTRRGGAYDLGTVFQVPAAGGAITTLATFGNANAFSIGCPNGAVPNGGLVEDASGNLFGTTYDDATYHGTLEYQFGRGTVFEVVAGSGAVTTLASFEQTSSPYPNDLPNGAYPIGGVIADGSGNLFGVTRDGGPISDFGVVFEVSVPVITTTTLQAWDINEPGYQATIYTTGGTGSLTFSESRTLPPGLTLSSSGALSGTPSIAGSYSFTVTVSDTAGATTSQSFTIVINPAQSPGGFDKYLVNPVGSSTVQAGKGFLVAVQAADQLGNPVNYSGPVPITISPTGAGSSIPSSVSLNSSGFGYFLATVQQAGSYTIMAGSGSSARSATVTVIPGLAAKLFFVGMPPEPPTPTGAVLRPISVRVEDLYGNVVTSDNRDAVTIGVGSGPGSFAAGSTLTASVHNGVATFSNLALVTPGNYQLSAVVPSLYTGPYSGSFTISPLQVISNLLIYQTFASPSGFWLRFNAPILANSQTPVMYGSGKGIGASVSPTVTLTQISGSPPMGVTLPYQVPGSLIFDQTTNTLTFLATNTESLGNTGSPVLADGEYVAHVSASGPNGLQALDGGGYLDGTYSGTPGHDYSTTFWVEAGRDGADVLWVPATAAGPGQALTAPGMNQAGGGYPIYLDNKDGNVTDVQATLTYNPALLTVTPTSTATFTVTVPSAGTAALHYSGPALAAGSQTPVGLLTAAVPAGTPASPVPYKAQDLLHLSNVLLNNGSISVVDTSDAVHLVAYVGDADGNGSYSSNDALLITRVNLQADSGFAAYPRVDPVIVADTDGSGFIPADAALQVNEAGVGVPTANLANPPIPAGVHFQALAVRRVQTTNNTNPTNQKTPPVMIDAADLDLFLDGMFRTPRTRTAAGRRTFRRA